MKKIGFIGKAILGLEAILLGLTIGCKDIKNNYQATQPAKPTTQKLFNPVFLSETEKRRYYVEFADGWKGINLDKEKKLEELLINIPIKTEALCINNYQNNEWIYFENKEDIKELIDFAKLLYKQTEEYKKGNIDVSNEFVLSWLDFMKYQFEEKDELSYKREVNFVLGTKTITRYLDEKETLLLKNNEGEIKQFIDQFWKSPHKTNSKRKIEAKPEIEKPEYVENYLIQDDLGYVSIRKYEDGHKTIFCRSDKCKTEEEFKFDKEKTEEFINMIKQRKKETEHIKETTDYWKFNSGSTYEILLKN